MLDVSQVGKNPIWKVLEISDKKGTAVADEDDQSTAVEEGFQDMLMAAVDDV